MSTPRDTQVELQYSVGNLRHVRVDLLVSDVEEQGQHSHDAGQRGPEVRNK